ncbi:hypothetical protein [Lachnobacterium bovis]|uniref:hypothetical protein n=1 Tax=Lachnobacterium bovis TaxID=140626 RepID=UPI0004807E74|nr:hypothetical protein [Lachnobacterium bovis]
MSDKFKKLSTKAKIEYIYDYYKLHIILGFIVIGILSILIYNAVNKSSPSLSIGCINTPTNNDRELLLTKKYIQSNTTKIKTKDIELVKGFRFSNSKDSIDYDYTYASNVKFLARITDKTLDVVVFDKEGLRVLKKKGYLLTIPNSVTNKLPDNALINSSKNANASKKYVAIKLNSNKNLYVGIIKNSPHKKEAINYLKYISGVTF